MSFDLRSVLSIVIWLLNRLFACFCYYIARKPYFFDFYFVCVVFAVVCGNILKKTFDRSDCRGLSLAFLLLCLYVCFCLHYSSGALLLLICVTILLAHLLHTFSTTITCVSVGVCLWFVFCCDWV